MAILGDFGKSYGKYSGWDQLWSSFFPSYSNPADKAMPYVSQMGPYSQAAYSPYMQTGQNAMNQYYNNASSWATPQGAMNDYNTVASGWYGSPAEQYDINTATQKTNQSAAASGQAGTPSTQVAVANQTEQLSNKYMQDYINSVLGIQTQGQQGLGNLTDLGFKGTSNATSDYENMLKQQSMLAYMGQMNQNASNNQPSLSNPWSWV